MTEERRPNGRKYTLVNRGLGLVAAGLAGCMLLAAVGRMTGDVATVVTVFFGSVAGLVGAFQAANAYVSGKTEPLVIQRGQSPALPTAPPGEPNLWRDDER